MQIDAIRTLLFANGQAAPVRVQARSGQEPSVAVRKDQPHGEDKVSLGNATQSRFSVHVDPATKEVVMRLIDQSSGQIIQQVPSAEMLHFAQLISQDLAKQAERESSRAKE
jgi:FlaG protein